MQKAACFLGGTIIAAGALAWAALVYVVLCFNN